MSTLNAHIVSALDSRSQYIRPGVKKAVKAALSRQERRASKAELTRVANCLSLDEKQHQALLDSELSLQAALDMYADELLATAARSDEDHENQEEVFALEDSDDGVPAIPLNLQGSLPDWMLDQLEAANGDAFATLSLFEAKRPSPKAAISMEDEALYA